MSKFIDLEKRYSLLYQNALPIVLVKGKGVWVWDDKGKKYLDLISSGYVVPHGHCHPELVKVMQEQSKKLPLVSRICYNDQLGPFLKKLCEMSGMDIAMPLNSGSEAVEAAIKSARLWGYEVKKIPKNKAEIIVVNNNNHGRTTTIVSFSTIKELRDGFGPLTPGFVHVPFGDAKALEKAITPNTCAFLVEPIQSIGSRVPPDGYLTEIAKICKKNKVLLILDEVQTGLCRTGKTFAYQHEKISPDGLIVSKGLGGSVFPSAAFLAKKAVIKPFITGTHGSSHGGNPLGGALGLKALQVMEKDGYAKNSQVMGDYLIKLLKGLKTPKIKEVRGKGLMIAVEFKPDKISGHTLCKRLLERGILTFEGYGNIIAIAPPLIITKKEIDWAFKRIKEVFQG